jgi:membrane fusion protein, multidrug efflux system
LQIQTRSLLTLGAVLAVVLAALSIPRLRAGAGPSGAPPPSAAVAPGAPPRALRVATVVATPRALAERLSTTGTLIANERVELVAEVAGKVQQILFDEGSRVESGQLLVKIDDTELLAQRERARFRLELAAQREAQQRRLLAEGIISQEEYDTELSQKNVLESEAKVIDNQLAKTELRAPFAGVIGLRAASLGSYLTPQMRVATLQDLDPIKLDFSIPEKYVGLVRLGSDVSFRLKGREQSFSGQVYAVEPQVDTATRSVTVRATSPNPGGTLTPGAFADVEITVREVPQALAVPAIAVMPDLSGPRLFVIEDGKAAQRPVATGMRTGTEVEIVSGLIAGERVITSGLLQLRPGQPVEAE